MIPLLLDHAMAIGFSMTHRSTLASVPEEEFSEKDRVGTWVKPGSKIDSDDFRKITQSRKYI